MGPFCYDTENLAPERPQTSHRRAPRGALTSRPIPHHLLLLLSNSFQLRPGRMGVQAREGDVQHQPRAFNHSDPVPFLRTASQRMYKVSPCSGRGESPSPGTHDENSVSRVIVVWYWPSPAWEHEFTRHLSNCRAISYQSPQRRTNNIHWKCYLRSM